MKNNIILVTSLCLSLALLSACENNGAETSDNLSSDIKSPSKPQASSTLPPQDVSQPLLGTWQVESIQGKAVIDRSPARFIFSDKQQVSGSASCNNFSTYYQLSDNHLTIQPAAVTRKMCPPVLMNQETRFLAGLAQIKRYQLKQNKLYLLDENDNSIFKASRINKK